MLPTILHDHRRQVQSRAEVRSPANPEQDYKNYFYDRFGHDLQTSETTVNVPSVPDSDTTESESETSRSSGTSSNQEKPRVSVSEAEIEEMIQTLPPLPPLPPHLNFIRTRPSSFNFNSLSFDILEYGQVRERENADTEQQRMRILLKLNPSTAGNIYIQVSQEAQQRRRQAGVSVA